MRWKPYVVVGTLGVLLGLLIAMIWPQFARRILFAVVGVVFIYAFSWIILLLAGDEEARNSIFWIRISR